MESVLVAWAICLLVLVVVAWSLGVHLKLKAIGILIDDRGRYSLTRFQMVLWTIVVLSLIAGLFFARWFGAVADPFAFDVPTTLLRVMGISLGGAVLASTIKAGKDADHPERIAASSDADPPRFSQVFLVEEGAQADRIVDVTKYQNFWLTVILVLGYIGLVTNVISSASSLDDIRLPEFEGTALILLGISHAGYLAGKLPNPQGTPAGLTLALRAQNARPITAAPAPAPPPTFQPRNPQ